LRRPQRARCRTHRRSLLRLTSRGLRARDRLAFLNQPRRPSRNFRTPPVPPWSRRMRRRQSQSQARRKEKPKRWPSGRIATQLHAATPLPSRTRVRAAVCCAKQSVPGPSRSCTSVPYRRNWSARPRTADGSCRFPIRASVSSSHRRRGLGSEAFFPNQLGQNFRRDFKRAQTRAVIVNLCGGDDFIGRGFIE